jgi:hypothetical protein
MILKKKQKLKLEHLLNRKSQDQASIARHHDHLLLHRHYKGCYRYDIDGKKAIDKADEEDVKRMQMRKKIRKMGRKIMRMMHKHWEDAEEEGSQEADEKAKDDDLGKDDRKHFIKEDGSKDDSEDTADEDVMKQDKVLKNQEIIKEELATVMDITEATEMKAETQGRVLEDTVEVDKDEALFNRGNDPEIRMESKRILNSQHSKNWKLKELMLLLLQVDMVMARDNLGQGQVEQCLKSLGCRLIDVKPDRDRREITGAVMLNKECEAGVENHQDRKLSMYEKPGIRVVTGKNNPNGKHDEVNLVRERVNMNA